MWVITPHARLVAGNTPGSRPADPRKASQMATINVVIIHPDGTVLKREIENGLGSFQAVVGGYIEGVFSPDMTIYVNEEGLIRHLPMNGRILEVTDHPGPLVGTALIVGPADDEGYDTDVPEHIIKHYELEN